MEKRTNQGQVKLRICLDLTNRNKAIIGEPYHFQTPDDIAHHLANACILTVCNCKKGYWYQALDEPSSYLTTFNMENWQILIHSNAIWHHCSWGCIPAKTRMNVLATSKI